MVKNLPAVQETWVWSLGWEDSPGEGMATHSNILPGKSHGQWSLVGYSLWGHRESVVTEQITLWFHFHYHFIIKIVLTSWTPSKGQRYLQGSPDHSLRAFPLSLFSHSVPTLCDPMDCSTPTFPVLHHLPEFAQTHVHWVSDAIQPSHPLLSSSPTFNLSQPQGLLQWVCSYHIPAISGHCAWASHFRFLACISSSLKWREYQ